MTFNIPILIHGDNIQIQFRRNFTRLLINYTIKRLLISSISRLLPKIRHQSQPVQNMPHLHSLSFFLSLFPPLSCSTTVLIYLKTENSKNFIERSQKLYIELLIIRYIQFRILTLCFFYCYTLFVQIITLAINIRSLKES